MIIIKRGPRVQKVMVGNVNILDHLNVDNITMEATPGGIRLSIEGNPKSLHVVDEKDLANG